MKTEFLLDRHFGSNDFHINDLWTQDNFAPDDWTKSRGKKLGTNAIRMLSPDTVSVVQERDPNAALNKKMRYRQGILTRALAAQKLWILSTDHISPSISIGATVKTASSAIAVPSIPKEDFAAQFRLWSFDAFSPSQTLLKFWKDGIDFFGDGQDTTLTKAFSRVVTASTVRKEFSSQLTAALIDELRMLRGPRQVDLKLFMDNGEFLKPVERRFSEIFPIRPRDLGPFLETLSGELRQYFANGNVLKGEWGRALHEGGNVKLELSPEPRATFTTSTKKVIDVDL